MRLKLFFGTTGNAGLLENSVNAFSAKVEVASMTTSIISGSICISVVYSEKVQAVAAEPKKATSRAKKKN